MTHSREEQTLKRICNGAKLGAVVGTGLGIFASIETPRPDGSNNDIEWAVIAIFSTAVFAFTGACVCGTAIGMASSVLQAGTDALNNARRTSQNTSNTQNLLRNNPATPTRKDTADSDDFEDDEEYEKSGFSLITTV
jgi:hypothetical protein